MEKVEFRVTADGRVMYRIAGKEEKRLTKFTKDIVEPMTALFMTDSQNAMRDWPPSTEKM